MFNESNRSKRQERPLLSQHLSELRTRLTFCCATLLIATILTWFQVPALLHWIVSPLRLLGYQVHYLAPLDVIGVHLKLSLFVALCFNSPIIVWNMAAFLWPAINAKEKFLLIRICVLICCLPFLSCGVVYSLLLPWSLRALLSLQQTDILPWFGVQNYLSFCLNLVAAASVLTVAPLMLWLALHLQWISVHQMRALRPYVVMSCFILAALITPPDVVTQILLAIPLYGLYELTLLFFARSESKRKEPR